MRFIPFILLASCLMAACAAEDAPLEGKRISVFELDDKLSVISAAPAKKIVLPRPRRNRDWPQMGGNAAHILHHLALGRLNEIWRVSAGRQGAVAGISASPVAGEGKVFTLDGRAQLHVFDARSGKRLWQHKFGLTGEKGGRYEWSRLGFGGGLAYARGRIFVATGFGTMAAVNAKTGKIIWRHETRIPFRAAPSVEGGLVYFLSFNNRLLARDVLTGRQIWMHQGISESSSLLVSSAAAVAGQIAVAPYNSGEIYALRARDKSFVWTDNLTQRGAIASSADAGFIAVPAIDRDRVYAISNAGGMVAISLTNGQRLWSQDISGVNMPWIAGAHIFVLAHDGILTCLSADKGDLVWRRKLPAGDGADPVIWHGPVLAGNTLLLTSSDGRLMRVNPQNGGMIKEIKLAESFAIAPIIADRAVFVLSTDMTLIALNSKS